MEAGAVAVAGGVTAIGSSLAVRRGTSTTKILPASSTTRTTSNNNNNKKKKKKKRPRRVLSRIRSIRTKTEKRLEKKYPKTVFVVVTLRLMFELARYYADVVGDAQLVWQMRNNDQLRGPFLAMVFFIGLQLCLGSAGLVAYMRYEHKASVTVLLALSVFSPPLVLALDTLMLMYRPTERFLPGKLVIFMVSYEAVRKLTEVFLRVAPAVAYPAVFAHVRMRRQGLQPGRRGPVLSVLQGNPAGKRVLQPGAIAPVVALRGNVQDVREQNGDGTHLQRVFQALDDNGCRATTERDQEQQGSGPRLFAAGLDGGRGARAGHGLKANKSLKTFKLDWRHVRERIWKS